MADDWRIRIDVADEEHARWLLERLGGELGAEAQELAKELEAHRLAVSRDGATVFVYAATRAAAEKAHAVVEAELRSERVEARTSRVERWLGDEERWDDEPPDETWEEEELDRGYAPWEVRVDCGSHEKARELADRLEGEGYRPARRFTYVIVGTASKDDAEALAQRLHGEVETGGEVVWESMPQNRFAIFGGIGL